MTSRTLLAIFSAACLPLLPAAAYPDPDSKPKGARRFDIIQYFPQEGREVSFGGDALKWRGKGECSQKESQEPIIEVQGNGVKVRNAVILGSPDGIHVTAKNVTIEQITFPDVCEDGITANGADRLVIRDCYFRDAKDKAIQLNSGKDILIENCVFEDCQTPIRVKPGVTVTVRNCEANGVKYFIYADGDAEVIAEGNRIRNSDTAIRLENGARAVERDNELLSVKDPFRVESGATLSR